jgi:hypothetical protein
MGGSRRWRDEQRGTNRVPRPRATRGSGGRAHAQPGGAKQRTVLALLLLRGKRSRSRRPARRRALGRAAAALGRAHDRGVRLTPAALDRADRAALVRRGNGYLLDPRGAVIDAQTAERLLSEATRAAAAGHYDLVSDLAGQARHCGAARRSPTYRSLPRPRGSRSCVSARSNSGTKQTWRSAGTAKPSRSCSHSSTSIRIASASSASSWSRSTAGGDKRKRSPSTHERAASSTRSWGSNRIRSSSGFRARSCGRSRVWPCRSRRWRLDRTPGRRHVGRPSSHSQLSPLPP